MAFRSTATSASSGGVGTLPAGVQAGDLLIAALNVFNDSSTITGPAGGTWTEVTGSPFKETGFHICQLSLWTRVAGGAEPATYTWTISGGTYTDIAITAYTSTTLLDGAPQGTAPGVTTTPTSPAITSTAANDLIYSVIAVNGGVTFTKPAALTERFNFDGSLAGADLTAGAAGSQGPYAWSTTNNAFVVVTVALKLPAASTATRTLLGCGV